MLRIIAAVLFGLEGLSYLLLAVQQGLFFLRTDVRGGMVTDWRVTALTFVGFYCLGFIFNLGTAVLLFQSRGQRSLRGGSWATATVVLTSLSSGLMGLGFMAMALLHDWSEIALSDRAERIVPWLFGLLGSHSLLLCVLGLLAVVWPHRTRHQPHNIEPAVV